MYQICNDISNSELPVWLSTGDAKLVFHANVKRVYSTFIMDDNKQKFGLTCMLQDASSPVGLIL